MRTRREFLFAGVAGVCSLVLPRASLGQQQSATVARIGFLASRSRSSVSNPDLLYDAFSQGMRDLGYVDGRNVTIEYRYADGKPERLPELAAELVVAGVTLLEPGSLLQHHDREPRNGQLLRDDAAGAAGAHDGEVHFVLRAVADHSASAASVS